jgi:septal ring factor EnvC (AmiA/AmiB activator)
LISCHITHGQSKEELRNKIENKEKEIAVANRLLKDTRASKESSLNELYILQRRIELRNELIEHLTNQVDNINNQIDSNQENIGELEKELKQLKDNYARIIYTAFKHNKGVGKLMFILSSESFNQAYKRIKYLNQLAKYRRDQAQKIELKTEKLEYTIEKLKNLKEEKKSTLSQKTSEKYKLKNEKSRIQDQITNLRTKEKQLRNEIEQNKQVVAQLENEIEQIIEEERKRTDVWRNLSSRQKEISVSFENNRGTIPWPVTDGIITRKFGENSHPVLQNIKMFNNGIDISASRNSKVKAIWAGEVRKVVSIPGANLTVIVRHGNYLSVYSNLVNVEVKPGDQIQKGDIIGEVYSDKVKNENVLHLEIYKENQKLNPEKWLR